MNIAIIGVGVVGGAILKSFNLKDINVLTYDIKNNSENDLIKCITESDIIFLCLPTLYNKIRKEYNKDAIHNICKKLVKYNYKSIVILKSTVEPGVTQELYKKYKLDIFHNPEFLTARTAFEDFHNQKKCYFGLSNTNQNNSYQLVKNFF